MFLFVSFIILCNPKLSLSLRSNSSFPLSHYHQVVPKQHTYVGPTSTQCTKFHRHDVAQGAFANRQYVAATSASDRKYPPADVGTMQLQISAALRERGSPAFCSLLRTTRGYRRWFIIKQYTLLSITVANLMIFSFNSYYVYKYTYIYHML